MVKKKRTYNTNLIKKTLSYSTNEIAELFHIHVRTVHQWYEEGLPRIDERKPYLVLGIELKEFIKNRQNKRKRKCKQDEFYCCKCKEPRKSWNNLVDIMVLDENRLMVIGICLLCNTTINKIFSKEKFNKIKEMFEIQEIHDKDLSWFTPSTVNTDIKEVF